MMDIQKNILKKYFGYDRFRKGQEEVINSILQGNDTIAIMPTGAGKSLCYQVPAMALSGITVVISPLISLMKDQVDTLNEIGIKSTYINSTLTNLEITERLFDAKDEEYKLVYVAPERLNSGEFLNFLNEAKVSLIAIDEAHCVSQWGHDFRPSYTRISQTIENLNERPIVCAFTATATSEVKDDIKKLLKLRDPNEYISGFDRENLTFSVIRGENTKKFICDFVENNKEQTGIVYTSTRKAAESIYEALINKGHRAGIYHAGLTDEQRSKMQEDFSYDNINVIVATNAFGMGIDKSNVRYVIHNNMPKNMESYYQEAGRAGRDGEKSECILLFNPRDTQTQKFFIEETIHNVERKEYEYRRLQDMIDYCHTSNCLRKSILEYFGEENVDDKCGNCSVCNDNEEKEDITVLAQKIISCVYRMQEKYGAILIAEVLRGSKNQKVLKFGLDKLSTYSIIKEYTVKEIQEIINKLIADDYLVLSQGQYPVVKMNKRSIDVLKGKEQVFMKINKKVKKIANTGNELFDILRDLRKEISTKENIPPYIVFSDASLKEMSTYMPEGEDEFLTIKGVGQSKLEKYGDIFMQKIDEYRKSKNIKTKEVKQEKENKKEKIKSHVITFNMYNENKSIEEIASERGIEPSTAKEHLFRCAIEGMEVDLDQLLPEEYEKQIEEVTNKIGYNGLKTIKENLPDEISYFHIKVFLHKVKG
ncbi:DNA helicase RecQ [Tepidibacter hydrothermalis]|uniref:DNA helicase RecQ n=2 Tax=Tepidibacter hydrothermalis TaxID=3036126 RepID=A0ABY8EH81_9FIRM|nr:DNA helicase RecQ [Tepidibacter hydrothermalis]WFD12308.1 DNA helicase RecQ [Tepidibacter hydrothermalis]